MRAVSRRLAVALAFAASMAGAIADGWAADGPPAKELFGGMKLPTRADPSSYGFYSKGCLAGGVAIPTDGPTWQAMRLSRNRRWGHPQMISLLERLSQDAAKYDGWPGLLLGDISQPRGGPMLSGHASHQIGLDADIWLTPMPSRTLSANERENISATSMLKKNAFLTVDPNIWTPAHARVIMRAASYPQVERIFVNPAIKKKLCETWKGDRTDLGKVRPYYGHDYHFHVRIKCPADAAGCKDQAGIPPGDGCDKSLAWWFTDEPWAKPKKDPNAKPAPKPKPMQLSDLPKACAMVLNAPSVDSEWAATYSANGAAPVSAHAATPEPAAAGAAIAAQMPDNAPADVPVPLPRPAGN
ncbi:penicillin-insensitive murein endopeptidase [Rhizobium cremeum]|uniref:penicillin-insensitive murein endopeptidase n=1 Tax=Rhizobium cremeum TaxID=2813827 RepID=UPI003CC7CFEF|nr:penicillin-insensitive murein endopeptidase [Rhizobium cremeum]MCJ8001856.1 penicillin-insensitive murein endopeptidase [Rhizobium cremeum]